MQLQLGLDELWACHKYVRRTREQEGQEYDKAFMLQMYRGIVALESLSREEQGTATYDIECEDGALWQVTRLVDMEYCSGGRYTGRSLLIKVMRALTADEPPDALLESALEVLQHAGHNHDDARAHDGAGDGAGT